MTEKYNTFITGTDGKLYFNPGDAQHTHMIPVTLAGRVQIAEADIKALEERVASLEEMLDDS